MVDLNFYRGKRILVTGHNGFKGSWMCRLLLSLGADVYGYALESDEESLFRISGLSEIVSSTTGDIRDYEKLYNCFKTAEPEIVIHMAAQPLVRRSYDEPAYTYDVNVMGTVNVLECIRKSDNVKSFVNVTTDKVYLNREWEWGYRENERLCGYDPYSNSKSCSELVTYSYANSFFGNRDIAIFTARAGNVIGGGDFRTDRIIPDCYRALSSGRDVHLRNPFSIRPYQHVLEPVTAYLSLAAEGYGKKIICESYNVGPGDRGCISTRELADIFCTRWNSITGDSFSFTNVGNENQPHEADLLKLDCSKIKKDYGISPVWDLKTAAVRAADWYRRYSKGGDAESIFQRDIDEFLRDREK